MTQRVVNYTYGTGNPVLPDGSIDVRDGIDNLQSMDVFMNAPEDTYNQRDGEIVRTVAGMNKEFDAQILNMGFTRIGTFASGATITNPRQTLLWDIADGGDGQEYGWSGAFPKVVPATSTPASTGGISVGAWVSRFDPEIMDRFSAIDGMGLIGSADYDGIRGYVGNASYIRCSGETLNGYSGSWFYYRDDSDLTTPDNGGTVLVDALNRRWKWDFQKNHTGMFWEEYGALIHRVGDRLLVGDAIKNGANIQNQPDWLTQYQLATGRAFGFSQSGQMVVQNGVGSNETGASNAIVAGAQTAHLNDNFNSIGILGIAVANKPTGTGNAYGGYFEGFRHTGAIGGAYGIEVDSINFKASAETDPYQQAADQTIGVQIAAGGELPPAGQFSCSAGMNIQNNGSTYDRGIVFGATSLSGCNGVTGAAPALAMAKGHQLQWFSGAGTKTTTIESFTTAGVGGVTQRFVDYAVNLLNSASKPVHQVSWGPGTINFPSFRASGTGSPIQMVADGEDTNIDIHLVPKGAAFVRFGQWTGQGDQAINGYIAIKDAAGNIRKIPTIA